ncbi:hypothetical protein B5G13_19920 [Butyricimonas sp. An62]|nr:hypothetical protein B5G13_19920 [Butyricimonas sp. An62]
MKLNCTFVMKWVDNKETSTFEVKSLLRLRYSLTSTLNKQIKDLLIKSVHSAQLRFTVINSDYSGAYSTIIGLNHRAYVKKVV